MRTSSLSILGVASILGASALTASACVDSSTNSTGADAGGVDATTNPSDANGGSDVASPIDSALPDTSTGTDAGTDTGAADAAPDAPKATSCNGTLPANCGTPATDDCCATLVVPGGTFTRSSSGTAWDDTGTATLTDFYLDKYEVTVGRFREFVNANMGTQASPPAAGAGANPKISQSGWQTAYNPYLPVDTTALKASLACNAAAQTWTDTAGANETRPITCTTWFTAFAFCAWDGGRLATEAEWAYAAAGGSEQRVYAWTTDAGSFDNTYANYGNGLCATDGGCLAMVGSYPKGIGKWGQLDLTGNVHEWTLDFYHVPPPSPCTDCADLTNNGMMSFHGGSFQDNYDQTRAWARYYTFDVAGAATPTPNIGIRCARD